MAKGNGIKRKQWFTNPTQKKCWLSKTTKTKG